MMNKKPVNVHIIDMENIFENQENIIVNYFYILIDTINKYCPDNRGNNEIGIPKIIILYPKSVIDFDTNTKQIIETNLPNHNIWTEFYNKYYNH